MSFFKKLKDRMFRSSDKIGEGLEALVAEGAEGPRDPVPEVPQELPDQPGPELPEPDLPEVPEPYAPEPYAPEPYDPEPYDPEPGDPDREDPTRLTGFRRPRWPARPTRRPRRRGRGFWGGCSDGPRRRSRAGFWTTPCWKAWRNC
jgi:fused signal recognition particle receptor